MKLRMRGNSLRLRVTQSEVEKIRRGEAVTESIQFSPASKLVYRLEGTKNAPTIHATFDSGLIRVMIPESQAIDWAQSQLIGLTSQQDALKILIEKDFACLKPMVGEDDSDAFPRPEA